jgi:uncharacterized protein YkwD
MGKIILTLLFTSSLCYSQEAEMSYQLEFLKSLNEYRMSKGCTELKYSKTLEKQSLRWLKYMVKKYPGLVHDERFKGYNAEILAKCSNPFQCWKDSKPHNSILLTKKATRVGIAFYEGRTCARFN